MNRKDHLGKYYQKNGRFQTKRDKNSIGFCVISNYREDIVISLTEKEISYEEALKAKNLPDPMILLYVCNTYNRVLDIDLMKYKSYWTNTDSGSVRSDFGYIAKRSCYSDSPSSGVGCLYVGGYPDDRYYYCGSRLYREMWRIEK